MAGLKNGPIEIYFDQVVGTGAYGEVCRAKCGMLPCAAKALHSVLFSFQDPGESVILKKFDEECQFLSSIKHPNIIQYLGTTVDEKSGRHFLLMELMDESLTVLLKRSKLSDSPLSCQRQVSICCDVALALTYLHSNDIIHRDLSSNNVLLLAGTRAKVADFGVSTIFDKNLNHLTACPGSKVYMPPEAQIEPPDYTDKLDCFSFGVLMIQIATLNFPDPGPLRKTVHNSDYPKGVIQVFVPESDRRESDIGAVENDHPLLPMALNCLEDCAVRPSAQELCEELLGMKSQMGTDHARKGSAENDKPSQAMFIDTLLQALEEKTQLLEALEAVDSGEMKSTDGVATSPKSDKEEVGSEAVATPNSDREEVKSKVAVTPNGDEDGGVASEIAATPKSDAPAAAESFEVKEVETTRWVYEPAPDSFSAYDGSCVFDTDRAYFLKKSKLYCYQYGSYPESGNWSLLTNTSYQYSGLALINRQLTTISGWRGLKFSRQVLTLHGTDSWKEDLPPILTGREAPACVATATHLIVLGGVVNLLTAITLCVEVLDLGNRRWSTATNIPELRTPQAVCRGNMMYLSSYASDSFYSCQIQNLLLSVEDTDAKKKVASSVWTKLQSLPPHCKASIATVASQLFAVGGENEEGKDTKSIYRYDRVRNWWKLIGDMPTPRKFVLVGVLPDSRVMCVGGQCEASNDLRIVEMGLIRELAGGSDQVTAQGQAKSSCNVM